MIKMPLPKRVLRRPKQKQEARGLLFPLKCSIYPYFRSILNHPTRYNGIGAILVKNNANPFWLLSSYDHKNLSMLCFIKDWNTGIFQSLKVFYRSSSNLPFDAETYQLRNSSSRKTKEIFRIPLYGR